MKNKVVFLDRDGTINIDFGYVYEKEKLKFLNGAIEGLQKLSDLGYKLIIITNQSGIGRGYFSTDEYNEFCSFFLQKLNERNIKIEKIYTCPHTDNDNCDCRKPKLGLFYKAIREYNVDLDNSYVIGDRERDLVISDVTGVTGYILNSNSNKYKSFKSILDIANEIELKK